MRIFSDKAQGNRGRLMFEMFLGLLVIVVLAMCLWPIGNGNSPYAARRASCISQLRQVGLAVQIYESDYDDSLPNRFTFDGPKQADEFIDATQPYMKSLEALICPADAKLLKETPVPNALVGDKHKMSYIHCLSLKGIIPNFDKGGRFLRLQGSNLDLKTTAYMREPIRSYGNPVGNQPGPAFLSSHRQYPLIGYLDGHVSGKVRLEPNTLF